MSETVIKVENLSKKYRLGLINHGMLSKDIQSWWARKRGKEDTNAVLNNSPQPSLSQREGAELAGKDEIYALKDINVEVKQGEVLGIFASKVA